MDGLLHCMHALLYFFGTSVCMYMYVISLSQRFRVSFLFLLGFIFSLVFLIDWLVDWLIDRLIGLRVVVVVVVGVSSKQSNSFKSLTSLYQIHWYIRARSSSSRSLSIFFSSLPDQLIEELNPLSFLLDSFQSSPSSSRSGFVYITCWIRLSLISPIEPALFSFHHCLLLHILQVHTKSTEPTDQPGTLSRIEFILPNLNQLKQAREI